MRAIGNGNAVPHREMKMVRAALRTIAGALGRAEFGRQVEVIGAPALGMVGEHELEQCIPVGIAGDGAQIDRRAPVGEVALERHLNRDGPLFEIVEREACKKHVGREAIGVDHAPRRVTGMLVHRCEDRIDLGFGLRPDVVSVVRIKRPGEPDR
jgi:hypothetical protein